MTTTASPTHTEADAKPADTDPLKAEAPTTYDLSDAPT